MKPHADHLMTLLLCLVDTDVTEWPMFADHGNIVSRREAMAGIARSRVTEDSQCQRQRQCQLPPLPIC